MSNTRVVLITGALARHRSRCRPWPSPKRAQGASLPVGVMRQAGRSLKSCALFWSEAEFITTPSEGDEVALCVDKTRRTVWRLACSRW